MLIEQPIRDSYIQTKILEERRSKGRELIRNYIHIYIHTITTSFIFPAITFQREKLDGITLADERVKETVPWRATKWIARERKGGAKGREKRKGKIERPPRSTPDQKVEIYSTPRSVPCPLCFTPFESLCFGLVRSIRGIRCKNYHPFHPTIPRKEEKKGKKEEQKGGEENVEKYPTYVSSSYPFSEQWNSRVMGFPQCLQLFFKSFVSPAPSPGNRNERKFVGSMTRNKFDW